MRRYANRRIWTLALTAAFCLSIAVPAAAGPTHAETAAVARKGKGKGKKKKTAKKGDTAIAEAKKLFAEGNIFFDSGQFARALEAYRAAYEIKPLAGFLINIAQCHRNLGNFEDSIFFYKKFMEEKPDSPHAAAVAAVISEMEEKYAALKLEEAERIAAEKAAAEAAAEADRRKRASLEAIRAAEAASAARAEAKAEAERAKAARASRPFFQRAWFWAVVGGALVAAGGATTLGLVLSNPLPEHTLGTWDCTAWPAAGCK